MSSLNVTDLIFEHTGSSGDEDDSKDKKGSVKIGGMRGFDD